MAIDFGKLNDLAAKEPGGATAAEIVLEVNDLQRKIIRALDRIRGDIARTRAAVEGNREPGGLDTLNGAEVFGLLTALGEWNALLRVLARNGIDPAEFAG